MKRKPMANSVITLTQQSPMPAYFMAWNICHALHLCKRLQMPKRTPPRRSIPISPGNACETDIGFLQRWTGRTDETSAPMQKVNDEGWPRVRQWFLHWQSLMSHIWRTTPVCGCHGKEQGFPPLHLPWQWFLSDVRGSDVWFVMVLPVCHPSGKKINNFIYLTKGGKYFFATMSRYWWDYSKREKRMSSRGRWGDRGDLKPEIASSRCSSQWQREFTSC